MKIFKKFVVLAAAAGLLVCCTAFAACEKESACAHQWERVSTTATCEASGMLTRKCPVCGTEETLEEPALGHDMKETDRGTPATCEESGTSVKQCSRCGHEESRTIPALGHDMREVSSTATCTEPGETGFQCSRCDKKETQSVNALGHKWEESVKEEATCQAEGILLKHCSRCGYETTETIAKVPHDLKPDFENSKPATCMKAGLDVKICKKCNEVVKVETQALGHNFNGTGTIEREATCEESGLRKIACSRENCDGVDPETGESPAVERLEIPKLGHDWQKDFTYDEMPTFESEGSRSIHCNRCEQTKDSESVPKLEIGKKVTYEFHIVRQNGEAIKIGLSEIKVTVTSADGTVVETSDKDNFAGGVMKVDLLPEVYNVTVTGLPDGYYAQESYPIALGSLVNKLVVNASLLPVSDVGSGTKYTLGSVMHDYTFKTVHGETVKLSDLLKRKKMVLFNFFFASCNACKVEMPGLLAAYDIYKNDIAIVMLDLVNYDTTEMIENQILNAYHVPSSIYVVQDMTPEKGNASEYNNICRKFGFNSAPQNVVIDGEGVVAYRDGGATSEMSFRRLFKQFTTAPYWFGTDEEDESAAPVRELEAILPEKREA